MKSAWKRAVRTWKRWASRLDDRDANLALALGAMTYGVSPVQLAAAYAPFGNGGVFNSPHFITKVTDASGRVL